MEVFVSLFNWLTWLQRVHTSCWRSSHGYRCCCDRVGLAGAPFFQLQLNVPSVWIWSCYFKTIKEEKRPKCHTNCGEATLSFLWLPHSYMYRQDRPVMLAVTHVHGRLWRGSWICSSGFPHRPTVSPHPQRTPAWHHWPPWSRTYSSGARPNCCRRRWQQSYACTHLSCASRTPGNACRSEGKRSRTIKKRHKQWTRIELPYFSWLILWCLM